MTTFKIIPDTTQSVKLNINTTQDMKVNVISNTNTAKLSIITGSLGPQGPQGPKGDTGDAGVVSATSPILYDAVTKTVSFDQTAENTVNDLRYFKRSGDTIDAGTII